MRVVMRSAGPTPVPAEWASVSRLKDLMDDLRRARESVVGLQVDCYRAQMAEGPITDPRSLGMLTAVGGLLSDCIGLVQQVCGERPGDAQE